ncbi:hypothetical protein QBC46DRAFT_325945 [Diplogelasinospora grovesii]|uniref:SKP1 component POZ domain-containing protein n=1 Tax=Diplogelasinospora grovesii TaxID=303347 RepID=A0AAN6MUT3_9PEZI|nr:hypothetical protein QBC46DRAFT_325945 [Diplogelasinospora grovesii]
MDKVTLISSDSEAFTVDARIFLDSMIHNMPHELKNVPIPMNINAATLRKVIEWCQYRHGQSARVSKLEYREQGLEIKNWERNFLNQVDQKILIQIIQAADFLDIDALFDVSCKKAASLIKQGSLDSVSDLPPNIQAHIAQNIPPNALKVASEKERIRITHEQGVHNQIWTSFFSDDDWFEAIFDLETDANPVLIGKSLGRGEMFVVLSSMDWSGDIYHDKRGLRKSLKDHDFDEATYECTMKGSNKVLNIWESRGSDHSRVSNVEERLVQSEADGTRWTSISYLRNPRIQRLENKFKPNGRLAVRCNKCLDPYSGKPLEWLCVDRDDTVIYRPFTTFESGR